MNFITMVILTCGMVSVDGMLERRCESNGAMFVTSEHVAKLSTSHDKVCDGVLCAMKDTCEVTLHEGRKELINKTCDQIMREMK